MPAAVAVGLRRCGCPRPRSPAPRGARRRVRWPARRDRAWRARWGAGPGWVPSGAWGRWAKAPGRRAHAAAVVGPTCRDPRSARARAARRPVTRAPRPLEEPHRAGGDPPEDTVHRGPEPGPGQQGLERADIGAVAAPPQDAAPSRAAAARRRAAERAGARTAAGGAAETCNDMAALTSLSAPTGLAVGLALKELRYAAEAATRPGQPWFPRSPAAVAVRGARRFEARHYRQEGRGQRAGPSPASVVCRLRGQCLIVPPRDLGARARRAAPPRGAGPAHGRRGARRAPARVRPAHRPRAHRAPASTPARFHETGALAGRGTYATTASSCDFLPANIVVGQGRIDGRRAVVQGDDFTVRGGAADAAIWQKMVYAERLAHDLRLPLVRLVDGTGGGGSVKSLEQMGFSYVPPLPGFELVVANLVARAGRRRRAGPGRRAGRRPGGRLALLGDRARHRPALRRRPAGGGGGDGRVARQGGARRRAHADARRARSTTRPPTRTTRSTSSGASSPTCPTTPGSRRPSPPATDPPDRREEELLVDRPARRRAAPTRCGASSRLVLDRGSVFELGRALRPPADHRARPARRAAGRRAGLRPRALRRRADRRRLREARPLRRPLRPVPPARSPTSSTSRAS